MSVFIYQVGASSSMEVIELVFATKDGMGLMVPCFCATLTKEGARQVVRLIESHLAPVLTPESNVAGVG